MNLRAVYLLLGGVLLLLAVLLLVPAAVALALRETSEAGPFLWSAGLTAVAGLALRLPNRNALKRSPGGQLDFHRREGLAAVGLSWLAAVLFGSLPFQFSAAIPYGVDAIFEAASGFTTTGCTILSSERIDALPRSIALWRMLTHWVGGIGIVLVFVVLFPAGGRSLLRSEVPGVAREPGSERVRDSVRAVVRVYLLLTLLHAVALYFAGLTPFDAITHAFSTMATGGFSNHGASVAWFDSWVVELILIVFMIAAGINFGLWDRLLRFGARRAWSEARESSELKLYLSMIAGVTLLCTAALWLGSSNGAAPESYADPLLAMRDSAFSVTSIQTCTGYASADFDRWPQVCRLLLMLCAFVGACTGSTGGGIKVLRLLIVVRAALSSLRTFARPRGIQIIRIDGEALEPQVISGVMRHVVLWILVALSGAVVLSAMGSDLETSLSAVTVCLNNVGPGLASVGPATDYGALPTLSKLLLTLFMVLGRLEFYALATLLLPGFWKR
jgi:trk system potassium uptake protein TrkH